MKTRILFAIFVTCLCFSLHAAKFWSNFRHSSNLATEPNQYIVQLRCSEPTGVTLEYRINNEVQTIDMLDFHEFGAFGGPLSCKATLNMNSPDLFQIGFRQQNNVAPVKYAGTQPTWDEMSAGNWDFTGDATPACLDLVDWNVSFNDDKLFIAMSNSSQSYPVNSGYTNYCYMGIITFPADTSPTPLTFALIYTIDQAGVINPGLYKINGTGLADITRIGDITYSHPEGTSILYLSCNWADLMADNLFSIWFNSFGYFKITPTTQTVTQQEGFVTVDQARNTIIYPTNEQYQFVENHPPVLNYFTYNYLWNGLEYPNEFHSHITYSDVDSDFPLSATIEFDTGESDILFYEDYNFDFPVDFVSITYFPRIYWQTASLKFWYTYNDYVEYIHSNVSNDDPIVPITSLNCTVYPNPFAKDVNIQIDNPEKGNVDISLFNIKGQIIKHIHEGMLDKGTQNYVWNASESEADNASGAYFLRISTKDKTITKKMVLVK